MDSLTDLFSKGYYVSLGALALLLETMQDEQKRNQAVRSWQGSVNDFLQDLTAKGVTTETEARSYVDRMVSNQIKTVDTKAVSTDAPTADVVDDLSQIQDLTKQIAELRAQLEQVGQ
jgi:polyhydroxyalkanoate synthesis regulator phasin